MTSNLGAREIKSKGLGFEKGGTVELDYRQIKDKVMEETKKVFRPEFLNRIDELIVFHPLEEEHILQIVRIMLDELKEKLSQQEISFTYSDEVGQFLVKEGFDPEYGARPLQRTIRKYLEDPLAEEMLRQELEPPVKIEAEMKDGGIVFTKK